MVTDVRVECFDIRNYAESTMRVTVFKSPCGQPVAYIPDNFTSIDRPQMMPQKLRSEQLQLTATTELTCDEEQERPAT